jgi:hypothetical protein
MKYEYDFCTGMIKNKCNCMISSQLPQMRSCFLRGGRLYDTRFAVDWPPVHGAREGSYILESEEEVVRLDSCIVPKIKEVGCTYKFSP